MHSVDICAVILAGGEGRRVDGRDKGLLPLAGKPVVAHVVAALQSQVGTLLISANRHLPEYALFARVIRDSATGFQGPLAGIVAGLEHCSADWVLTVPVDSPDLPADLARRLHSAAMNANASGAVVHDGSRREPLFALYRRTRVAHASDALRENLAVWRWQDEQRIVEADFSDKPQAFANLNTLEAFRDWERRHDFRST